MKHLYGISNHNKKANHVFRKYKELIDINENKTKRILLLVPNNSTKIKYEKMLNLEYSEEININTYLTFIKKEIIKFWPIINGKCEFIDNNTITPTFINTNLSEYILYEKIDKYRRLDGYFNDIIATSKNIAKGVNNNINKAASNLIEFSTIGERIYLSKKNKDILMRFSYSQMDEIISSYINLLLSKSILDNPTCIYLYNNYLLNDESYIKTLDRDIDYLIVDSLELSSCSEVDFISEVSKVSKESYVYLNSTRDYSSYNNIDFKYINEQIIELWEKDEHSNVSYENNYISKVELSNIYSLPVELSLNQSSQLYSDMIEEACSKVVDLIKSGISPNDIAIISPINNTVLDYHVKKILHKNNIKIENTNKDKKLIDYPYGNAILVACCIFYDYEELIRDEEYINFIETILETNRIEAFKILKNKDQNEIYVNLRQYIVNQRNEDLKIHEFLIKFYIDKMINLKHGKENVNICKKIINDSETFIQNISLLGLDIEKSKEEIFIEVFKSSIKDYYTGIDINEIKNNGSVILTTPHTYISNDLNKQIQLWIDIGSNSWNMKIEKELNNNVVLRQSFNEKEVYSDIMEEGYKKYYLYNMIFNLLYNCKKVYAYKSDYTVNGYIQESILYGLLLKIIDKGGKNE